MEVSRQDLIKIVEQASTLTERLGECFIPDESQTNEKLITSQWETWCQVVAQSNPEKFAKRLAWDGLDSKAVGSVLGSVRLVDPKQLPVWTETLREVLQSDWETADADASRCLDIEKPIPFEEVYLPFVYVARQKLIAHVGASWQLLSEAVHISLERQLLLQLASLSAQPLQLEFSLFKALKQSAFTLLWGGGQDIGFNSNKQYQTFVKDLKTGKLLSIFQKYNVLARLVATAMDLWVEEKAEFFHRLALNLSTIQQNFQKDIGQVVAIQLNLSDLHNRGRSVIALTFASGLKLIYKPRSLGLEVTYFELLAWCNQQQVLLPFKLLKVIDCKTHGWMEFVEHLPCEDEAAVQRYYQRAGMLLCLLYVLQGNDCHDENLIASGEHPVLVDLETLLHPRAREVNATNEVGAQSLANEQFFEDSVLWTGLLPRWEFGADGGNAHDISGLGGAGGEIPFRMPKWQNINTDNMALEYEPGIMPPAANTPLLNDITLSPNDYVNELIDGFRQMYQFLSERREVLLATDSPIAAFAHQKVRFLFRPTQVYSHVLGKALNPNYLRHGVDYSIELDVLSRAFLAADAKPPIWSLLAVELQALEQMDIPYFVADSSSDALIVNPDLIIEGYFKEPSYNRMIRHLQRLNDADLAQQIAIIRGSFYSRVARGMTDTAPCTFVNAGLDLDATVHLTQLQLVHEAVEIAKELQQRAIQAADGSVTWIGMGYLPKAERMQLQPLGDGLYDGVCGVALFLAALAKVTDDTEFRDLALSALQPLRKTLQETDTSFQRRITKQMGISGSTGLGSIVYALVRVSQSLDEPELLNIASLAASLITQESIASDRSFDIIAGAAGAILGLLSFYQASSDPAVLDRATALGYHLLINRTKSNSGFRAWATLEGKLATGFSHGAAGIAYALLRLYKTTQETVFLEAAEEAIAYERSVFSPNAGNWPDVRSFTLEGGKPSFITNWCHGAPGIGLGRLGGLEILDTPEIRQEIAVALNTTQQFGLQNIDHLCCGNFGRMEVLLVGACKLSRPELWNTVQKQAAWVVARAKQVGTFYLFPELRGDIYNPGFFQGTAGIGYELLRLAYPESLPSVLLWE
ncbi:Lanthionine synthetase C family protein [Scytonema hofmannii PCC 7110]|uniref:Lanthionine synthetase C family protein n=1 Tax=Scytonema hofmannii PCC 7110 TaxID=128403 RepID=A0A139X7J7_9CYAN|nr:type 2 lanthipeptide synthetase LanM family protein [Scytonema hofmannii]KYC40664.1 Lanthionine synthetase C family protein [Scytonema hofmannii PCC 7110]